MFTFVKCNIVTGDIKHLSYIVLENIMRLFSNVFYVKHL